MSEAIPMTRLMAGTASASAQSESYSTARPVYSEGSSTATGSPAPGAPAYEQVEDGVLGWLASEQARPYEGQWVALDAGLRLLEAADSPARLPQGPGVVIAFVLPRDIRISG